MGILDYIKWDGIWPIIITVLLKKSASEIPWRFEIEHTR